MRTITNKKSIKITDLSFTRANIRVLRNINLEILPASHVALLGSNGSGKSTLLELIIGTLKPDQGTIDKPQKIAFVPQRSSINDNIPMTVRDVVNMGRWADLKRWQKLTRKDKEIVDCHLERLGLTSLANRELSEHSGGQRQRTFIARALAQNAQVLILDEPEAGLDADATDIIGDVLKEETLRGVTVIIATHDLNSAKRADRCIVLSNTENTVVADGRPDQVLEDGSRLVSVTKTAERSGVHAGDSHSAPPSHFLWQ